MSEISLAYNIPYLDYRNDNRIASNPLLFKNSNHLNKKGIVGFNKNLFEDLIKPGVISVDDVVQKRGNKKYWQEIKS